MALLATSSLVHASAELVTGLSAPLGGIGVAPPTPNWVVGTQIGDASADVTTLAPLGTMGVAGGRGYGQKAAAADPHGRYVYLPRGQTWVIDSTGRTPATVLDLPGIVITRVAVEPSGARLFALTTQPGHALLTIDLRTRQIVDSVALLEPSHDLVASPDGLHVWVLGSLNRVSLVDTRTHSLSRQQVPGGQPVAITLDHSRRQLFVARGGEKRIDVLSADTLAFDRSFPLADSPSDIVFNATADLLYVDAATLSALDPATGAVVATSGGGFGAVVSPDERLVYRLIIGECTANEPSSPGCRSHRITALDARTLQHVGQAPLDTRTPEDPSWSAYSVVANFLVAAPKVTYAIEYFNAQRGHYFITASPVEIGMLDRGDFPGWQRTGESMPVYQRADDGPTGTTPVCRFHGRPEKGLDSHFYSASPAECAEVLVRFGDSWMLEANDVFHGYLPDAATGACPFETTPVYRFYNNRPDVNHRYTTSQAIRSEMLAQGWTAEGYGADTVGLCVPR